jgi:hypothetical protein
MPLWLPGVCLDWTDKNTGIPPSRISNSGQSWNHCPLKIQSVEKWNEINCTNNNTGKHFKKELLLQHDVKAPRGCPIKYEATS